MSLDKRDRRRTLPRQSIAPEQIIRRDVDVFVIHQDGQYRQAGGLEAKISRRRDQSRIDLAALQRRRARGGIDPHGHPLNVSRRVAMLSKQGDRHVIRRISDAPDADLFARKLFHIGRGLRADQGEGAFVHEAAKDYE
jgi:hypothetical protein